MNSLQQPIYPELFTPNNFPNTVPGGTVYRIPDPDQVAANEAISLENHRHNPKNPKPYSGSRYFEQLGLHIWPNGQLSSLHKQIQVKNRLESVLHTSRSPLRPFFEENKHDTYLNTPIPIWIVWNTILRNGVKVAERNQDALLAAQLSKYIRMNASNDALFDKDSETSRLLTHHIKNLNPKNPIKIKTAEYPVFDILKLTPKKFEWSSGTYHIAKVQLKEWIKNFLIREEMFVVGDLSRKILWEIDDTGRFRPTNQPCTITSIRSKNISSRSQSDTKKSTILWNIRDTFAGIRKWFRE